MTDLSIELTMLLWATVLYVVQILIAAGVADIKNGIPWGLGNREEIPEIPGWGGRAKRAQQNMAENLLPFAILVLIVTTSGKVGDMSVLGAQVFLASRIVYALLYIAGVKVLRSLAYGGGLLGMGLIVAQLM